MPLSMFSSRAGVPGIPWGLGSQNSHRPQEFNRQLWHGGGTSDVSAWKSTRNYVKIWRHVQGIFDTKLCHMDRELNPIFQNSLIPCGNPPLPLWGKTLIGALYWIR